MNREAGALLVLEHQNGFTKKSTLASGIEIEQRQTSSKQALLGPCFPPFLHHGRFIIEFALDERCEAGEVVLATLPCKWHFARNVAVCLLLSSAAVHAPHATSLLHASWRQVHPISVCLVQ